MCVKEERKINIMPEFVYLFEIHFSIQEIKSFFNNNRAVRGPLSSCKIIDL